MKITMARMDNRLMHGVVIAQYLPPAYCQRIIVIDHVVATTPSEKEAMMFPKPNGYAASIITLEKALENFKANKYEGQRIFILAKTPRVFLELVKIGVPIPELILGATDRIGEGIKLSNRCYFTEEEVADTKELIKLGVNVVIQHNPSVSPVPFSKVVK